MTPSHDDAHATDSRASEELRRNSPQRGHEDDEGDRVRRGDRVAMRPRRMVRGVAITHASSSRELHTQNVLRTTRRVLSARPSSEMGDGYTELLE